MAKVFRVIDFETTGLRSSSGIMEIGITDLVWEGKSIEITDPKQWYTNPGIECEIGARAIHHITDDMIEGAPHPSVILQDLATGVDFFAAHNAKFDKQFYNPTKPWICTMKVAQNLYPMAESYKNQYLRYFLGLEIDRAKADPPHSAGPDTYVTAHILRRQMIDLVKQGKPFVETLIAWSNSARLLKEVAFGKHKGKTWEHMVQFESSYCNWVLDNTSDDDVRYTINHLRGMT